MIGRPGVEVVSLVVGVVVGPIIICRCHRRCSCTRRGGRSGRSLHPRETAAGSTLHRVEWGVFCCWCGFIGCFRVRARGITAGSVSRDSRVCDTACGLAVPRSGRYLAAPTAPVDVSSGVRRGHAEKLAETCLTGATKRRYGRDRDTGARAVRPRDIRRRRSYNGVRPVRSNSSLSSRVSRFSMRSRPPRQRAPESLHSGSPNSGSGPLSRTRETSATTSRSSNRRVLNGPMRGTV